MNLFLSQRDTTSKERMDDPNCDLAELENTYQQFATINSLISQWRKIYRNEIRPLLVPNSLNTMLDIGFGGGDIPLKLAKWASSDGFDLQLTAIDPDPRAFNFIQKIKTPGNVDFLQCPLSELDPVSSQFDFIISNHLIHHLTKKQLHQLLRQAKLLSTRKVIFNDIHRDDWAYFLFNLLSRPVFRSSFITEDGLTSIKRSYTKSELSKAVPEQWQVKALFPFRLLLTYDHD